MHAERLEPAEGASVTIDRAELHLAPGARIEDSTLLLTLRASRGASEQITFPPGTALASLEIDGRPHPVRLERGVLELPLDPGGHRVVVRSKRAAGLAFRYAPSTPAMARPLTNVLTSISVPPDRWLLATGGPAWGPAVLLWGHLIAIVLAAFALGRVPLSPLRGHQWALLGLGLTQVEAPVALIVVGWFSPSRIGNGISPSTEGCSTSFRSRWYCSHWWRFPVWRMPCIRDCWFHRKCRCRAC